MKLFIPLLILMSLLITETVAQTRPAPTGFTATSGDRQVTLSWSPPSNIGSEVIRHYYTVYGGVNETLNHSSKATLVGGNPGVAVTSHTLNFNWNITYKFSGFAQYDSGSGALADPIIVTTAIPAPTDFTATLDEPTTEDRTVTLTWTAPSPVAADITDYQYSQNGGDWTSTGGGTNTTKTVTGLKNGDSYSFRVRADRTPDGTQTAGSRGLASRKR